MVQETSELLSQFFLIFVGGLCCCYCVGKALLSDIMFWNKKLAFSWTCRCNFSIVELTEDVACSGDSTLLDDSSG